MSLSLRIAFFCLFVLCTLVACSDPFSSYLKTVSTCQSPADCPGRQLCTESKCVDPPNTPTTECKPKESRPCYTAESATKGVGSCKEGTQTCSAEGKWGFCENEVTPTSNPDCNGEGDTNCNGTPDKDEEACKQRECQQDQTQACYTGPDGTKDVGICKEGTQTCTAEGKWGPCEGEKTPQGRDCASDADNDCSGKSDKEECGECQEGQTQACYTGPSGTKDVGICKGGMQTCTAEKKWGPCEGEVTPAAEEICFNGLDDQCQGKRDFQLPACRCKETKDCKENFFCYIQPGEEEGACLKTCSSAQDCPSEQSCTTLGPSAVRFCLQTKTDGSCDPAKFLACPPDQHCAFGTCEATQNNGTINTNCNNYARRCQSPLECVFLPLQGACMQPCTNGNCPTGKRCMRIPSPTGQTLNICATPCAKDADCTHPNLPVCSPATLGNRYCIPRGGRTLWQSCQLGGSNCQPGLRCMIPPANRPKRLIGACIPDTCSGAASCTPPTGIDPQSLVCAQLDGNSCLLPCGGNPDICKKIPGFFCRTAPPAPPFCAP